MKIEVAKDDLDYLRSEVAERFRQLANTPAAINPEFRSAVARQLDVLRKFGTRLNQAHAKVYGSGCHKESFCEDDVRR